MSNIKCILVVLVLATAGCAGNVGAPGPAGQAGPQGLTGTTGAQGLRGTDGSPGLGCSVTSIQASDVAPAGGSLIQCGDGTQSLVLDGTNGLDGQDGTPGTVVTPIQFCPGAGSYPDTFPEVGFCLGGNLYAVYSANGGFLTEVLPGTWSSDGINASCTFTVAPSCVVTNQ